MSRRRPRARNVSITFRRAPRAVSDSTSSLVDKSRIGFSHSPSLTLSRRHALSLSLSFVVVVVVRIRGRHNYKVPSAHVFFLFLYLFTFCRSQKGKDKKHFSNNDFFSFSFLLFTEYLFVYEKQLGESIRYTRLANNRKPFFYTRTPCFIANGFQSKRLFHKRRLGPNPYDAVRYIIFKTGNILHTLVVETTFPTFAESFRNSFFFVHTNNQRTHDIGKREETNGIINGRCAITTNHFVCKSKCRPVAGIYIDTRVETN